MERILEQTLAIPVSETAVVRPENFMKSFTTSLSFSFASNDSLQNCFRFVLLGTVKHVFSAGSDKSGSHIVQGKVPSDK